MSGNPFNWSLVAGMADEAFGIPPDVTFQIVEGDQVYEIRAHKTILGLVSPSFKMMFYTTEVGDKTSKVVKIGQTTAPAFQTLIDAIYHTKSLKDSLKGKSIKEIFDVIFLIEQYQIGQLKDTVKELLSDYPVTDDSVLEVAGEAMEYSTMFQKEAKYLLRKCAEFLKDKLKDVQSIFTYAAEINDGKEVFTALLALMKDISPMKCLNCGYEDCQDGNPIDEEEFRVGLMVTNNKANDGYWAGKGGHDFGTGKVRFVIHGGVGVDAVKPGADAMFYGGNHIANYGDGFPNFLFSCK